MSNVPKQSKLSEDVLDQLSTLLGFRLESIVIETEHREHTISNESYYGSRWRLHRRINGAVKQRDDGFAVWNNGDPIRLPPDPDGRLETIVDDA